ncbi:hypothetical protein Pelo_5115 [Pelomyxa schiedti]|nr:hypothetical protein Pelo_5115 [Pelomyxa schiedti]
MSLGVAADTTTTVATHEAAGRSDPMRRVLALSRLLWDAVVSPGWLGPHDPPGTATTTSALLKCSLTPPNAPLFSLAEALFPLVARACRRAVAACRLRHKSTYNAIADAAAAGSPACVAWLVAHKRRSLPAKEVVAVLRGLCLAGQLGAAQKLVGTPAGAGTLPKLWDGRSVAGWGSECIVRPNAGIYATTAAAIITASESERGIKRDSCEDTSVVEVLQSEGLVNEVCGVGGVDVVKWLVSLIGIGKENARWMLRDPLWIALRKGHLDIAGWMLFDGLDLVNTLSLSTLESLTESCAIGRHPENLKWCLEKFPQGVRPSVFVFILGNKHSSLELCQWLAGEWQIDMIKQEYNLLAIKNPDIAMWLLENLEESEKTLEKLVGHIGNVSLAEWLIREKHFTPTLSTLFTTCSMKTGGSTLSRWLSTRLTLSQSDLLNTLQRALQWSNREVADWLEDTFHLMDVVNSDPELASSTLVEISKTGDDCDDVVRGLKWFIDRLSKPREISATSVQKAISQISEGCWDWGSVLLLLETFPQFELTPPIEEALLQDLWNTVLKADVITIQHFVEIFPTTLLSLLTQDFVSTCLTSSECRTFSSKVVKWVIGHFHLDSIHIKANHSFLLCNLLSMRKNQCAEWLLESFSITLEDIIDMVLNWYSDEVSSNSSNSFHSLDVQAWKMIVKRFPTINSQIIRDHLMYIVVLSPFHAIFTMDKFGITLDDIRMTSTLSWFPDTQIWLQMA